jgi:hypothetical protein
MASRGPDNPGFSHSKKKAEKRAKKKAARMPRECEACKTCECNDVCDCEHTCEMDYGNVQDDIDTRYGDLCHQFGQGLDFDDEEDACRKSRRNSGKDNQRRRSYKDYSDVTSMYAATDNIGCIPESRNPYNLCQLGMNSEPDHVLASLERMERHQEQDSRLRAEKERLRVIYSQVLEEFFPKLQMILCIDTKSVDPTRHM